MTKDSLAEVTDAPTDEILRLQAMKRKHPNWQERKFPEKSEREAVYYTIPRDDWVRVESTHNAASRVGRLINERIDDPSSVRVGVSTTTDGQHGKKAVKVKVRTGKVDRIREGVLASTKGKVGSGEHKEVRGNIPVVVERDETERVHNCKKSDGSSYYDGDYQNVPGGSQIQHSYDEVGNCTSGSPA